MKKVLMLLLLSSAAWGYEIKDNPDRYPSVGLNYYGESLKGDTEYQNFVFLTKPETKQTVNNVMADVRLPITSSLTLEAGGGYGQTKVESNDGTMFSSVFGSGIVTTPMATTMRGPVYKVGARYYFH